MITYPPVKINLGLNVLRKREDGYHDLETLFYPCSQIHDTLEIVRGDDYSKTSARLKAVYGDRPKIADMSATALEDDPDDDYVPTLSQGISGNGKLMITVARREGVDWPVLKDLCAKAYMMLDEEFSLPPVKIFLEKTSPVGAGLGGGSADAAFALSMLSEMFSLGLSKEQLAAYAARLGSDCPFFIWNRPMIGEGRGEVLTPYNLGVKIVESGSEYGLHGGSGFGNTEKRHHESSVCGAVGESAENETGNEFGNETGMATSDVDGKAIGSVAEVSEQSMGDIVDDKSVEMPTEIYELKIIVPEDVHISTAEAYKGIVPAVPETDLRSVLSMPVSEWSGTLVNDFERTVFAAHPELAAIKQSLYDSGAVYASMSGSGSALFALYKV